MEELARGEGTSSVAKQPGQGQCMCARGFPSCSCGSGPLRPAAHPPQPHPYLDPRIDDTRKPTEVPLLTGFSTRHTLLSPRTLQNVAAMQEEAPRDGRADRAKRNPAKKAMPG